VNGEKKPADYSNFWDEAVSNAQRSWPVAVGLERSLERYVKERIPTGDFLRGVLENDLTTAVSYADEFNLRNIRNIALFVRTAVPIRAQGSKEKVLRWLSGVE
jgi:hypothetical protein